MKGVKHRQIRRWAWGAISMICALNAVQFSSSQQLKTGEISGHVGDEVGATIAGASVFVRSNYLPMKM